MVTLPLIAVDVGNARVKFGHFSPQSDCELPEAVSTLAIDSGEPAWSRVDAWLRESALAHCAWWVASVRRPTASWLLEEIRQRRPADPVTLLEAADLPLVVDVPRSDAVGIDRLLDAVGANRLRQPGRPAVVVDVGTAITVDLISAAGSFFGGAILPGLAMAARALHEFTDLLPLVDPAVAGDPPPALGTDTHSAMVSGLFWGTFGGIEQLVGRLGGDRQPQVFFTGGGGAAFARLLGRGARYVPDLALGGIAVVAAHGDAVD